MQILENATGGEVEPEAETQEVEQPKVEPEAPKAEETAKSAEPEQAEEKESKGVQIDRITLKDVTIKYGLPVKIPMDIELTGIGAESENGASFEEVWDAVFTKVKSVLTSVGGAIGDLGKGAAGAIKDAGGAAVDTLKDAGGAAADTLKDAGGAAADALKSAGDGIKNLFK